MTTPVEGKWSPYAECPHYTSAEITLPENFEIKDAIKHLVKEGIINKSAAPVLCEHGVKRWDISIGGLSQRLISTQEGKFTIYSSRDRSGERDMTFERLVCDIRTKIEGAGIQIFT